MITNSIIETVHIVFKYINQKKFSDFLISLWIRLLLWINKTIAKNRIFNNNKDNKNNRAIIQFL